MFRLGTEDLPVCVIVPAGPYVDSPCTARTIEVSATVALGALVSLVDRRALPAHENYRG